MPETKFNISQSIHPEYAYRVAEWQKWRYVMEGGDTFVEQYVKEFNTAEDATDFAKRKEITPVAGFAAAAVRDVNNAIFQRMHAIRRTGGTESWQASTSGQRGGVDLGGSSMTHFIGTEVLPELLSMGKVGIFVDNFAFTEGRTKLEAGQQHPYIYTYKAEEIRNWEWYVRGHELRLKRLLLRVSEDILDPEYLLVNGYNELYRYFWEEDGVILVQNYDGKGKPVDIHSVPAEFEPFELKISQIPLVVLELQQSLLQNTANHQIALTNFESADTGWLLRSNVPVYTEQFDQRFENSKGWTGDDDASTDNVDQTETRTIGASDGIRYPIGAEQPNFIHPSPEPLQASMDKQKNLKDDIRALVNLAVTNTKSRFASAESKQMDERGLESGLSAIGLVLEHAEGRVARLWSEYESSKEELKVGYPERYSLKTDEDRRKDAEQLASTSVDVSSHLFRKEIQKEIAEILLAGKVADETLDKIMGEIDESNYPTADPKQIRSDVEAGLVSREFASGARGYPKEEASKAKIEKLEAELARERAQMKNAGARGLDESDPESAKLEKEESQNPENNPDGKKLVRGEGK
jgi:hypothetical protein